MDTFKKLCRTALGRSIWVYHYKAGACDLCAVSAVEAEAPEAGVCLTASPRHADVILVTGPLGEEDRSTLEKLWEASPEPRRVVVAGECGRAEGGRVDMTGVLAVDQVLPTDEVVPGCPPEPVAITEMLRRSVRSAPSVPQADLQADSQVDDPDAPAADADEPLRQDEP